MLIKSPKHTAADLQRWAEYERADKAHGHSRMLGRNYRRCEEIALSFIDAGPSHVAVSWGKDSVVVANLVLSIRPAVPLVWFRVEPIKSPECVAVRDAFLKIHPRAEYHEIEVWCRNDTDGWHATGTLETGIQRADEMLGPRTILGIRADESGSRKLSVLRWGPTTVHRCRPLAYLSAPDVFALLHVHGLPVHPAYGMLGGGRWERHRLRVASLGGERGDGFGRAQWEAEYYGEELRRLAALDPARAGARG